MSPQSKQLEILLKSLKDPALASQLLILAAESLPESDKQFYFVKLLKASLVSLQSTSHNSLVNVSTVCSWEEDVTRLVDRAYYAVYVQEKKAVPTSTFINRPNQRNANSLVSRPRTSSSSFHQSTIGTSTTLHSNSSSLMQLFLNECQNVWTSAPPAATTVKQPRYKTDQFLRHFGLAWENLTQAETLQQAKPIEIQQVTSNSFTLSPTTTLTERSKKISLRRRKQRLMNWSLESSSLSCLETVALRHQNRIIKEHIHRKTPLPSCLETLPLCPIVVDYSSSSSSSSTSPKTIRKDASSKVQCVEETGIYAMNRAPAQSSMHSSKRQRIGALSSTSHNSQRSTATYYSPVQSTLVPLTTTTAMATAASAIVSDSEDGMSSPLVTATSLPRKSTFVPLVTPTSSSLRKSTAVISVEYGDDDTDETISVSSFTLHQQLESLDFWPTFMAVLQLEITSRILRFRGELTKYKVYRLLGPVGDATTLNTDVEKLRAKIHQEFQSLYTGNNTTGSCQTHIRYHATNQTMWIQMVLYDVLNARGQQRKTPTTIIAVVKPESSLVAVTMIRVFSSTSLLPAVLYALNTALVRQRSVGSFFGTFIRYAIVRVVYILFAFQLVDVVSHLATRSLIYDMF
jgi:hypothetical protein